MVLAVGALSCAAVAYAYGLAHETVELVAFSVVLVALSVVDIEQRRIPDTCIAAALLIRAVYIVVSCLVDGLDFVTAFVPSLVGAVVLGGGMLVATLVADRLSGRGNLGGGDIKLFAVVGFYFGMSRGAIVLVIACLIGVLWGLIGMVLDRRFGKVSDHTFAFGPPIALACVAVMLASSPLVGLLL